MSAVPPAYGSVAARTNGQRASTTDSDPLSARRLAERGGVPLEDRPPDRDLGDREGRGLPLFEQPSRERPDDDLVRREPAVAGEGHPERLERQRAAGPRERIRRLAPGEIRRHDERTRTDEHVRSGTSVETVGERVIGQGPIGVDPAVDDLGHGVRHDEIDALEGRDDGLLRGGQAGRRAGEAHIPPAFGRGLVGRLAQDREPALAARRRQLGVVRAAEIGPVQEVVWSPAGHVHAGVVQAIRKLPPDGYRDDREIGPVPDEVADDRPARPSRPSRRAARRSTAGARRQGRRAAPAGRSGSRRSGRVPCP